MKLYNLVAAALVAVSVMTVPAMAQNREYDVPDDQPVATQGVQLQTSDAPERYHSADPADDNGPAGDQLPSDDSMAVPPPTSTTTTTTSVSWDEQVASQAVKAVQTQGVQPRVIGPLEHELKLYRDAGSKPRSRTTRRQMHQSALRLNGILGRITSIERRLAALEAHDKVQDSQIKGIQTFVHGLDKSLHALTGNVSRLWSGHNSFVRQQKANNKVQADGIAANAAAIGMTSFLNFILGVFVIGIIVVLVLNFLKERKASCKREEE